MIRVALLALVLVTGAARVDADWAGNNEVPLDGGGSAWLVHAMIDGTPGTFLLDTGASVCVVSPATAARVGVRNGTERIELHTANGTFQAPLVTLRTVEIGATRARDVQAVVHQAVPPPLDGIIGLSFLNRFSYAIDPRRRMLRLH